MEDLVKIFSLTQVVKKLKMEQEAHISCLLISI